MTCATLGGLNPLGLILPEWPAPSNVRALVTTRRGGESSHPWSEFNLGDHVGDDPATVAANRELLARLLPGEPHWLRQVHGTKVFDADREMDRCADAALSRGTAVLAVLTADCLPVLFCSGDGGVVACAHAGWRGLAAGVLEATLAAMDHPPDEVIAWLGPAIGPHRFEVGRDVVDTFCAQAPEAAAAFAHCAEGKWLADIYYLARLRLRAAGVCSIHGGGRCTHAEDDLFFSYRRDGITGRMASLIWREDSA